MTTKYTYEVGGSSNFSYPVLSSKTSGGHRKSRLKMPTKPKKSLMSILLILPKTTYCLVSVGDGSSLRVTRTTPTNDITIEASFVLLMCSTRNRAPTIMVKKDDVDERMVWDDTEVYSNDAFVTRLDRNHRVQNQNANWIVSLAVSGGYSASRSNSIWFDKW
ncbi:hypothetical protein KL930_001765 [Ogataea haglerorum]|uniref:Uncharacterized protein n=1 Tax=Ogataea haglerorum TaxID=1937702 RepID=A0AAN6D8C8_9ASCO|nr:uncharacterized protein KL911_001706 [Ogataea haglerorum]KAG7698103.1 hypothetical protein KL915_001820 [Ogataea haglerorum]KAG7699603.1 hypothetical protein KL951_001320 [Ogataea haglerorum]KAG7708325.1 hypothetical protein KL914_002051 [Ogataea haglerorum]KAG7710648.1 hypothetical protein KL950_001561 [Ogataea haglerorum]KAG7721269.1 hypothetical protein KL913_001005 [Ogataea haglerorum]